MCWTYQERFVFSDLLEKMLAVVKERFQTGENRFRQMSVLELEDIEKYDVVTAIQWLCLRVFYPLRRSPRFFYHLLAVFWLIGQTEEISWWCWRRGRIS